jgi:hypothetical protein
VRAAAITRAFVSQRWFIETNPAAFDGTPNRGFRPDTRKAFVEAEVPAALPPSARPSPDFPSPAQITRAQVATGNGTKL